MVSVHDPDARHVHKTTHDYRDGYKAHVAVEPETGIITAATLTAGNVADATPPPSCCPANTVPVRCSATRPIWHRRAP
jgi:hypothetical protein